MMNLFLNPIIENIRLLRITSKTFKSNIYKFLTLYISIVTQCLRTFHCATITLNSTWNILPTTLGLGTNIFSFKTWLSEKLNLMEKVILFIKTESWFSRPKLIIFLEYFN